MTDKEVVRLSYSIVEKYFVEVPKDMESFIRYLGIKIKPLSFYLENGFSTQEVFDILGNDDGAAMKCDDYLIVYNDKKPPKRIRFTLAEELMHIVLGHTDDERFELGKDYDTQLYQQYEHEAKLGASILLMPPSIYFRYKTVCSLRKLASQLNISEAAAFRIKQFYDVNEWVRDFSYQPLCDIKVNHSIKPIYVRKT